MTQEQWEQQLKSDGYSQVAQHKDPPNFEYPEHSHPVDTSYVVLQGNMVVQMEGQEQVVGEGQRLDIGKQVVHWARVGAEGCTFLIGIRM